MQEIKVKNDAGLKVYINGVPKLENIPKDILDCFIDCMSQQICDEIEKRKNASCNDTTKEKTSDTL